MDIVEAALLEEFVRREGEVVAYTGDGGDQLCAGSQVGDIAQELNRVSLLGQRVRVSWAVTNHFRRVNASFADLQIEDLSLGDTFDELALELVACADFGSRNILEVGHRAIHDNLECLET